MNEPKGERSRAQTFVEASSAVPQRWPTLYDVTGHQGCVSSSDEARLLGRAALATRWRGWGGRLYKEKELNVSASSSKPPQRQNLGPASETLYVEDDFGKLLRRTIL